MHVSARPSQQPEECPASDSNNAEVFDTHVGQTLLKMLGATGSDQPPMHPWHLPHGRKSEMCLVPLDMTLLDSMTIYVKKHLAKTFFNHAHACVSKRIMPSPALIGRRGPLTCQN